MKNNKKAKPTSATPSKQPDKKKEKKTSEMFTSGGHGKRLEDWRVYAVIGVSVVVLLGIFITQYHGSMKGADTLSCVVTMAALEEAIKQMDQEFVFDFDRSKMSDMDILQSLNMYYSYGKFAFEEVNDKGTSVPLQVKSSEKITRLAQVPRETYHISTLKACPNKGTYSFETPAGNKQNLPNIRCSVHGLLERPDKEGRYVFHGAMNDLDPVQRGLSRVAHVMFPPACSIPKEYVEITSPPENVPASRPIPEE